MGKIIQFQIDAYGNTHVLCDDGSLWCFQEAQWKPYTPIPQEPGHD